MVHEEEASLLDLSGGELEDVGVDELAFVGVVASVGGEVLDAKEVRDEVEHEFVDAEVVELDAHGVESVGVAVVR